MSETIMGYARCSTDEQDLTAQRQRLAELGVAAERIYLDHGLTGTTRARPGLDQALAVVRPGDTLVVPKLDRLARSVPDARAIGDALTERGNKLSLGGQVYDPTDPMGKMFFNILFSSTTSSANSNVSRKWWRDLAYLLSAIAWPVRPPARLIQQLSQAIDHLRRWRVPVAEPTQLVRRVQLSAQPYPVGEIRLPAIDQRRPARRVRPQGELDVERDDDRLSVAAQRPHRSDFVPPHNRRGLQQRDAAADGISGRVAHLAQPHDADGSRAERARLGSGVEGACARVDAGLIKAEQCVDLGVGQPVSSEEGWLGRRLEDPVPAAGDDELRAICDGCTDRNRAGAVSRPGFLQAYVPRW